jgi:hypothetical protein
VPPRLLLVVLGALAALALVARRRRARPAAVVTSETNGAPLDRQESLRRFVEAGESRYRAGSEQASTDL